MRQKSNLWIDGLVIGVPLVVITFLYSFALIDPVLLPKYMGWGLCLIAFGLVLLIQRNANFAWVFQRNPLLWALGGYLALSAISLLHTRNLPEGFLEWFKGFFLLTFIIFLSTHFSRKRTFFVNGVTIGTACLAYVAAAFGFYQFLELTGSSELSHTGSYAISGTFAHRNLYAEILFLTLPFNLYGFRQLKGVPKWFCLGAAFVALFIIIILMSRAVWLSVATGIMVPVLIYGFIAFKKGHLNAALKNQLGAVMKATAGILLVIVLSVFVYTRFDTATAFKKQVVSIFQFNFTYGSIKDRIDLWSKSWQIIQDRPLTGVGTGDWEQALLKRGNKGMLSADNKTFFQRPHNDFLWVCSESGIFAMLCYIGVFAGAFYMLIVSIWKADKHSDQLLNYMLLFALSGYLTYALFSFPKERIEHQVLLGFVLAMTVLQFKTGNETSKTNTRRAQWPLLVLGLVIIASGVFLGAKRMKAEAATHKALKARMNQNPEAVIRHIRKAESAYYPVDPMSTPLRWYSGSAHHKLGNHEKALEDFKAAYRHNPYHMHVVNNLGTLYQIHEKSDSAIKYYNKALELSPQFTTAALNLAAVHYNQGETDKALEAIRALPYKGDNPKYEEYLTSIVRAKTQEIKEGLEEDGMQSVIARMLNDNQWLRNIYKKSLAKQSFKHQLLEDMIYVLEKGEKSISFEEAKQLKQKYLPHD